jgi:hypothetical protein
MKSESFFQAAMRASRLMSCAALAASVAVLASATPESSATLDGLMSAQAALCGVLLALAAIFVSFSPRWCHGTGQALALLSCVIAFGPFFTETLGGSWSEA